jgi:hypothetical protein
MQCSETQYELIDRPKELNAKGSIRHSTLRFGGRGFRKQAQKQMRLSVTNCSRDFILGRFAKAATSRVHTAANQLAH